MRFDAPWNVKGVRLRARDTAREAARRAGLSVGDWLNSTILEHAAEEGIYPPEPARTRDEDVIALHQKLAEAIERIDRRLDQLIARSEPDARQAELQSSQTRYAAKDRSVRSSAEYRPPAPPGRGWVSGIDDAVAQISARQRELDIDPAIPPAGYEKAYEERLSAAGQPPRPAWGAPWPSLDLSGLEQQLRHITTQIENLRQPGGSELEQQLRLITERIESLRGSSGLEDAVSGLRRELAEIGRSLMEAMPRRAIEALENEMRNLAERITQSRQSGVDESTIMGLARGLIEVRDALRALTPAESLVGYEQAVRELSHKIDTIATTNQDPGTLHQLETMIATLRDLVSHVASNDVLTKLAEEMRNLSAKIDHVANSAITKDAGSLPSQLDTRLQAFTEQLQRSQANQGDPAALSQIQERIAHLSAKLDISDARLAHLDAIERGLTDLVAHFEELRGTKGFNRAVPTEPPVAVDALKQDLSKTQDSLETAHGAIDHVVDRLAMIETNIRDARPATTPTPDASKTTPAPAKAAPPSTPPHPATPPKSTPPAIRDRRPINPDLPPDFPLEPGSGASREQDGTSAADRIAASEAALGLAKSSDTIGAGHTNFIAAARRAAQAATPSANGPQADDNTENGGQSLGDRVRKFLVGTSVVLLAIGGLRIAVNLLEPATQSAMEPPASITRNSTLAAPKNAGTTQSIENFTGPPSGFLSPANQAIAPVPATTAPASNPLILPDKREGEPQNTHTADLPASDVTGSIPALQSTPHLEQLPQFSYPLDHRPMPSDKLPPGLRNAATRGDPVAEYEIGLRYLEGRGVPLSMAEAARWLERAAKSALAPAQFRLGSLYEKGQGVKKNLDMARKLYLAAAGKGNTKAMHNLAVLYAEGIGQKPDYKTAALWFRKAADHGVPDSQYNLGILYARGIGVERNLAESYKWFALAATQGDKESAKKRDDLASHLDADTLTAAKLAVQTFVTEPQAEHANEVRLPKTGWDTTPPAMPAKKRAPAAGVQKITAS